jgi:hypothetical protein
MEKNGGLNVYSFNGENLGSVVVRNGKAANVQALAKNNPDAAVSAEISETQAETAI